MAHRYSDAKPTNQTPAPAVALRQLADLLSSHPGLPPIDHANLRFAHHPPHADLWVAHPAQVGPWAQALGTHVSETAHINDSPAPSYTITDTPRVTFEHIGVRIIHLRYLTPNDTQQ
jgi:hypothetical protein